MKLADELTFPPVFATLITPVAPWPTTAVIEVAGCGSITLDRSSPDINAGKVGEISTGDSYHCSRPAGFRVKISYSRRRRRCAGNIDLAVTDSRIHRMRRIIIINKLQI